MGLSMPCARKKLATCVKLKGFAVILKRVAAEKGVVWSSPIN